MSKLDETIQSDLEAMDEAIERGTVAAGTSQAQRELQEIALAVAWEAPEPDPDFSAEMRERVREGFPRDGRAARFSLPGLPKLRRPPMIALAALASVLAALAVAVPLLSGEKGEPSLSETPAAVGPGAALEESEVALPQLDRYSGERSQRQAGSGPAEASPVDDAGPIEYSSASDRLASGESKRRIERSAALTIEAPEGKLDRVADEILTVTDRYEGFVLRSNVTSGEDGIPGGRFELRVPADRLQAALRDLSKLGDVRSRTQSGADVTRAVVSASDRLEGARAERRSLLRRLEDAETDEQAESIRQRLDFNASETSGLRGQLRDLRLRTNYARVNVTLDQNDGSADEGSGAANGDGLRGALDDALGSLSASVEMLVRALGVLIPITILAALLWLGGRAVRRRRREAALSI